MIETSRHKEIFNPEKLQGPVCIVGCGGMGSRIAEGLIRMGVGMFQNPLYLFDHDAFESHNVANQWVDQEHLGMLKVKAVKQQMLAINPGAHVTEVASNVQERTMLEGVVFLCIDSMASRRVIMEKVLENNKHVHCVIETRMDAGVGISHCFNPNNKKHCDCWWLYWHSDAEAENMAGCGGYQSIISAVYGTSMLALKQFEQFARVGAVQDMPNRIYQDFDMSSIETERW